MTEQEYDDNCSDIVTKIWDITTAHGWDIDDDLQEEHMHNCHAAVANSYFKGITLSVWWDRALARLT